jgi:hypothetical protein
MLRLIDALIAAAAGLVLLGVLVAALAVMGSP